MQMVQTAADPPNQGRIIRAITGWTWNSRKALTKIVKAYKPKAWTLSLAGGILNLYPKIFIFLGNLPGTGGILIAERVIRKTHPCALAQECPVGSRTNEGPEPQNSGEEQKAPDPGGLPVWRMPVTMEP
jgi:hypothetical protein